MKKVIASIVVFFMAFISAFSQTNRADKQGHLDPFAACSGLGVESGSWGAWQSTDGYLKYGNPGPVFFAATNPQAPKYTIVTGNAVDACSQNNLGNPTIPVVCPGFGNSSIRLGEIRMNGLDGGCTNNGAYPGPGPGNVSGNGCTEKLTYPLTVTVNDTNFIYAYAMVVENPPSAHLFHEAPAAEIYILDQSGDTVPCSHRKYTADLNGGVGPGFYPASCPGVANDGSSVSYKPWTIEGINLTKYIGQNLTVVITNTDCAKGGHFCYSYWDFSCGVLSTNPASYCIGSSVSITAPSNPLINYTYQWYKNDVPYNPNGTSQTIIPFPVPGDTFVVEVKQPSGCNFKVVYVPTPMTITPNFTFNSVGGCGSGVYNFQDISTSAPTGASMVSWNWSFPGGTPSSSTVQNPTNISYPPGTYTASLVVASQNGCKDTIQKSFTFTADPPPVAAATTSPVCFNQTPTVFQDHSTGTTAITQWLWNFGDGNSSTQQNPSHTFGSAGTFSVTLAVTDASGCKDTVPLVAIVNPLPTPNFTSVPVCLGDTTCFTDQSTISKGSIVSWNWNFDDPASGTNNISNIQSPCHVYSGSGPYSVVLTVISDSGCSNTLTLPVTTLPPPNAAFTMPSSCIGSATTFVNSSTSSTSTDPINNWAWLFGDGSTSNVQNPTHFYSNSGTYTATLVVTTQAGCKDTTTKTVTLYRPPVVAYSDSAEGCAPLCAKFNDLSVATDGTIASWNWSFPGGNPSSSTASSPTICWNTPGVYDAQLIVTNSYGCKDTLATPRYIHVFPWPNANFGVAPDVAPSDNPLFSFSDLWTTTDVVKWNWNFGDGSPFDSTHTDPIHSYSAIATQNDFYKFNVCLNVQNTYGCWDTICRPVEILPEFEFYIPNSFTPNTEGPAANENFFGKCRGVKEYQIWVFDRWGNLLWDCHVKGKNTDYDIPGKDGLSAECKWDGKIHNAGPDLNHRSDNLVQEDVYVWKVKLTDIFNKKHTYIGHVSSVR